MSFKRLLTTAKCLGHARQLVRPSITSLTTRCYATQADIEDPNMNGGYINPPPIKRQFRDPYGDWWDKQERRNFGEPVHEDNDILGVFSTEEYTHFTSRKAFFLIGCAIAVGATMCGVVYLTYPDKPSAPRTFPDGLEAELGGPGTLRALKDGEEQ